MDRQNKVKCEQCLLEVSLEDYDRHQGDYDVCIRALRLKAKALERERNEFVYRAFAECLILAVEGIRGSVASQVSVEGVAKKILTQARRTLTPNDASRFQPRLLEKVRHKSGIYDGAGDRLRKILLSRGKNEGAAE